VNVDDVVILFLPRDQTRSNAATSDVSERLTSPPPWSRKFRWRGRWDPQHGSVVHIVERIRQSFASTAAENYEDDEGQSGDGG
jgi:hypothetical protein